MDKSSFSVRLQDLKLWQGSYDSLHKRADSKTAENHEEMKSKYEYLSPLDNFLSPERSQTHPIDWDRRQISPSKPFEQLLEEKLAQDVLLNVVDQPKRPFLRKGQGLARFRMKPNTERWKPPRSVGNCRKSTGLETQKPKERTEDPKTTRKYYPLKTNSKSKETPQYTKKGILKKTNFSICQNAQKNKNIEKRADNFEYKNHFEGDVKNKNTDLDLLKYLETPQLDNHEDLKLPDYLPPLETYDQYRIEHEGLERFRKNSFSDKLEEQLKELDLLKSVEEERKSNQLNKDNLNRIIIDKEMSCNIRKQHEKVDMTPLTIPNFMIQPRHRVINTENDQNNEKINCIVDEIDSININSDQETTVSSSGTTIDHILRQLDDEDLNGLLENKVNFLAMKHFLMTQARNNMVSNNIPSYISEDATLLPTATTPNENVINTQDESQKELRLFEALEKKTANSSFCSTSTSIVNLLSSTPQRDRFVGRHVNKEIAEDISTPYDNQQCEESGNYYANIQQKLSEITKKTDVLQDFLLNLKKIDKGKSNRRRHSDSVSSLRRHHHTSESTMTSFSDEERWSTRSPSPTVATTTTTFDSSYQSAASSSRKVDMAVNTSFDRLDETIKEGCAECEEVRSRLLKTKQNLDETNTENIKLKLSVRNLEKNQARFDRDVKNLEKKHNREIEKLKEELESEKKKFAKEKMVFETYVKEAQNRPTKKEREEITQLKQELADAKELIKLKETKSGATQARLRTQIKQLEKEVNELQTTVEKLQKENAKLSANQKLNRPRPSEMKMLHEINKNISKLTEETMKKQPNRTNLEEETTEIDRTVERRKSREKSVGKENEDRKRQSTTPKEQKRKSLGDRQRKESSCSDSTTFDIPSLDNISIEKQYEHVFGHFDSPRANTSTTTGKTERTLEDGTIEIRYSNGNVKTISPDGNLIKVRYFNGDCKETNIAEKTVKYHYAENDSWHTQYGDGTEVVQYADGQTSKKHKDGKIEITYPDGTVRTIHTDGTEEERFPDGSQTIKNQNGEQIILLPNGQKEIHTKTHKRREYPDGTVRTLHKDGTVETVYANGRVRVKDPNGVLIMDTHGEVD